jgi:methylenetetrahydrofolate reductase (NADPH)
MCGATFPDRLTSQLESVQEDKAAQFEIGVEFAIEQCRELLVHHVAGIHFYALNRSPACERILDALGIGQKDTPHV